MGGTLLMANSGTLLLAIDSIKGLRKKAAWGNQTLSTILTQGF